MQWLIKMQNNYYCYSNHIISFPIKRWTIVVIFPQMYIIIWLATCTRLSMQHVEETSIKRASSATQLNKSNQSLRWDKIIAVVYYANVHTHTSKTHNSNQFPSCWILQFYILHVKEVQCCVRLWRTNSREFLQEPDISS